MLLVEAQPESVPAGAAWTGLLLLAGIWIPSVLLHVPRHRDLGLGFNTSAHLFLVLSNWIRTALWSARGLLVLWMVAGVMARFQAMTPVSSVRGSAKLQQSSQHVCGVG